MRKRCKKLVSKVNVFVSRIIDEHRLRRVGDGEVGRDGDDSSGDFVDVLLDLEKESRLSDSDMIAVLWVSAFKHSIVRFITYCRNMFIFCSWCASPAHLDKGFFFSLDLFFVVAFTRFFMF